MKKEEESKEKKILNKLIEILNSVQYGEIVITKHDSKVVQIEKKEKIRII
jgi:hypothetical protein